MNYAQRPSSPLQGWNLLFRPQHQFRPASLAGRTWQKPPGVVMSIKGEYTT